MPRRRLTLTLKIGALLLLTAATAGAAPDWTLEDPAGNRVSFAEELARGPVVVSFWATWCKPCLKELPHLEAMAAHYEGRVTFLAVNTDDPKSVAKVQPLVRARGWTRLKVLLDPAAAVQQLLQVDAMPYLVLYDREGGEAYRHTGYAEGDEERLRAEIEALLAGPRRPVAAATSGDAGELSISDRFEYSYATGTRREIVENWLDAAWARGPVRAGLTLNSQAPGEEQRRRNQITHRWFELTRDDVTVRAGHFLGLFGRGLVFNAWQDRDLRVDTHLDGVMATARSGRLAATVMSGAPSRRELDVRGADLEWSAGRGLVCGASGLTWHNSANEGADAVDREWAAALRLRQSLPHADWYAELGGRNRFSLDAFDGDGGGGDLRDGWALYGNLNLYGGPFTVSWEASDYRRFELVSQADGVTALNRPPSLAREYTWTLFNRAPHSLNANDEKGHNLDVTWRGPGELALQARAARLRLHDGRKVHEAASLAAEFGHWRGIGLQAALGYQDSEGQRRTAAAEADWQGPGGTAWSLQAEHQHVRVGGGVGFDLGAYHQQWFKLECALRSRWLLAAMLETNDKYAGQRSPSEDAGPFLALQAARTLARGALLTLWAGRRQEGYLCSGGVCKFEPAFSGAEFYGTLRW
jgi:thiol-disulfide isomerase/thioredoxin